MLRHPPKQEQNYCLLSWAIIIYVHHRRRSNGSGRLMLLLNSLCLLAMVILICAMLMMINHSELRILRPSLCYTGIQLNLQKVSYPLIFRERFSRSFSSCLHKCLIWSINVNVYFQHHFIISRFTFETKVSMPKNGFKSFWSLMIFRNECRCIALQI
jgi:hypothetical protein